MKYSALVVAAGSGSRMKLGYNKVYMRLSDGKCLLDKTLSVFMDDPDCTQIVVVTDPAMFRQEIGEKTVGKVVVARGGETRQESVHNGLMAVLEETVFVHDGARPFLKKEVLERLKGTMETEDAALLMVPCKDTIKRVIGGYVEETYDRSTLMCAQTPQAFRTSVLISCMDQAVLDGWTGTDYASVVEKYSNVRVAAVEGDYANLKVTTPEDIH